MSTTDSISVSNPHPKNIDILQKLGLALSSIGLLIILVIWLGNFNFGASSLHLLIALMSIIIGTTIFAIRTYMTKPAGIQNNQVYHNSLTNRGIYGWMAGILLTGFYICLYWFPSYLGLSAEGLKSTGLVALFDPLSMFFKGQPANQWFVYGTLYTLAIISMGIKFMFKYRHNRYHLLRTFSIIIAQLFLAYLIPEILEGLNQEKAYFAKDIKYFWPLNYYFFEDWHLNNLQAGGTLGMFYFIWGIAGVLLVVPVLTYFLGKRWYCSWVCGCGGLAETAGDPFRQLSSKKLSAWKLERWLIHGVLLYIVFVTSVVLYTYFTNTQEFFGLSVYTYFRKPYAFLIGAAFSGVIGVGFYPLLGNRVWCRFGCPLAAYMGLIQRFKSKFRITTNGGQCISCGNCSTYCEQGIDVRAYAQKGQNIVRASCVGCGICAAVCPRGVLKLENIPNDDSTRYKAPEIILGNQ